MYLTKNTFKIIAFTMLTALIFVTATPQIFAGNGKKNRVPMKKQTTLWQQIDESRVQKRGIQSRLPEKYLVFRLNQSTLKNSLAELPFENSDAARENPLVMEVPMPDGSIQKFRMEQTAVLSPELAADFPDWKTFTGYGIDDPTAIGQFDWNILGFHGYIETDKGIVFIDPYQKGDTQNYLVFYKHEYGSPLTPFSEREISESMSNIIKSENRTFAPQFSFGTSLRTYRLAIATTGEWARVAAQVDPTNPTQTPIQIRTVALAVIQTSVTRLNGIYQRELASRFQLVNPSVSDENRNIVYDNPNTDPYDNSAGGPGNDQLAINHTTLVNRVGQTAFDIGHLYGTTGGGVAAKGSLCNGQIKGQGYSARPDSPTGDPFTVDYVAHEIGHQFGADHTYNNLDTATSGGVCDTRAPLEAFEVASGSTIMSYVGICTAGRNLQQNVDFGIPSFHIASMTVINTNITTGDPSTTGCGIASGTNNVPVINAGAAYTIPKLTPFELTASATDADAGDNNLFLYSWEEYDLAPTSPPPGPTAQPTPFVPITGASGPGANPANTYDVDTDGVLRPLFRAFSPRGSNARIFPSIQYILNTTTNDPVGSNQPPLTYTGFNVNGGACNPNEVNCVVGERLPTVNRTMNFRVSVRDRRGGVADAGTTVTVAAAAGPFNITSQNTNMTLTGNTQKTITWNVAGTTGNDINAANVNILLSRDGGQTFPIILSQNTPNDGSEIITIPNISTPTARIKIQPTNNIFFDINNGNLTINAAPTAASVSIRGRVLAGQFKGVFGAIVKLTDQNGNVRSARTNFYGYYNFLDVGAGQTYIFTVTARGYQFSPQVLAVSEDVTDLNFRAQ